MVTRVILRHLREEDDVLVLGDIAGEMDVVDDSIEVAIDDPELQQRVLEVVSEPISVRAGFEMDGVIVTRLEPRGPDHPEYLSALRERLEQSDLRLQVEIPD